MGRFQQLRVKALSLRGAIAVGGALVMAVSMTQVAGTLAAPDEVREAKAGIATQNYFPTPLTSSVTCTTDPNHPLNPAARRARIDWEPVPGATAYRVDLVHDNNGSVVSHTVNAPVTRLSGVVAPRQGVPARSWGYLIRVRTINGDAVSSGYTTSAQKAQAKASVASQTECEGSSGPSVPNEVWENEHAWTPDLIPFAVEPIPSIFAALFDDDASQDLLGELPEGGELTSLDDAAFDTAPATSEAATSAPSSTPPTTPSSPASSETTTAPTTNSGASASLTTAARSTSASATTSSPQQTASSAGATPSTKATTSSSTPAATTTVTTVPPTVSARVGDDPIAVGTSKARLDDVDGQTQLIITRNGSQVCTADVDGASRIDSSGGELTVTVSGRTKPVDLESCKVG